MRSADASFPLLQRGQSGVFQCGYWALVFTGAISGSSGRFCFDLSEPFTEVPSESCPPYVLGIAGLALVSGLIHAVIGFEVPNCRFYLVPVALKAVKVRLVVILMLFLAASRN